MRRCLNKQAYRRKAPRFRRADAANEFSRILRVAAFDARVCLKKDRAASKR